jgi:NitT/TauT family transport system permease protein
MSARLQSQGRGLAIRRVLDGRYGRLIVGGLSVLTFLIIWQLAGSTSDMRAGLFSYPTEMLSELHEIIDSGELGENLRVTLIELVQGFFPAVVCGILLGVGFALNKRLRYLVEPLFIMLYIAPYVAFIPVLTVWFGVGGASKAIIVFIASVVPVTINTATGVREVSPLWVKAVRAFGGSPMQVLTTAVLPGALPSIMAGIRLAVGRAIVAVVAAEMYVAITGIGHLIQVYSLSGRTALILLFVGMVSAFGLVCVSLLRLAEEKLAPWRDHS